MAVSCCFHSAGAVGEVNMGRRVLGAPVLPDGFWLRSDVADALAGRDFGVLFRLVSKYAGASQTQIAIAVTMTQGQISGFMAGRRQVLTLDVAERVLDGLGAPDSARLAFGLAPRSARPAGETTESSRRAGKAPASGITRSHPAGARNGDDGPGDVDPGGAVSDDGVNRRGVLRLGAAAAGLAVAGGAGQGQALVRLAQVLTGYSSSGVPVEGESASVADLAVSVAQAKRGYQACRYSSLLSMLPALLAAARLACERTTGDDLLRAQALAADAYQVTGSLLLKLGDQGLAGFAADRSMQAALSSGSPVSVAASSRIVVHSLMSGGHASAASEFAGEAAQRLSAEVTAPDDEVLSVYGALVLRGAAAAANAEDRDGSTTLLDEAGAAADRLGRDDNAHWTAFGPTNVALHRVNVAVVLGDAGTAVDLARHVDVDRIALPERKAALYIDIAQAYEQWGRNERALHALLAAERVAPEEVSNRGRVHRLVGDLTSRAPRSVSQRARELGERIGVAA